MTPGPELGMMLAGVELAAVRDEQLVGVLQASWRQLSHGHALYLAAMVEVGRRERAEVCRDAERTKGRAGAGADAPAGSAAGFPAGAPAGGVAGQGSAELRRGSAAWLENECWGWCTAEIGTALTFTGRRADTEFAFALDLVEKLPQVLTALRSGEIDVHKARVFARYLAGLADAQIDRICRRLLPRAPKWTTGQLAARLLREVMAIDPGYSRRRYVKAARERGVWGYLDVDGTAVLGGHGLSPSEAAAAAERLEDLAGAIRAAGHPRTEQQLRADLFLRLLDGRYAGHSREQIISAMLAETEVESDAEGEAAAEAETEAGAGADIVDVDFGSSADDLADAGARNADTRRAGADPADTVSAATAPPGAASTGSGLANTGPVSAGSTVAMPGGPGSADAARPDTGSPDIGPPDTGPPDTGSPNTGRLDTGPPDTGPPKSGGGAPEAADDSADRTGCHVRLGPLPADGARHGVEVRVGLGTLLGLDDHPAELAGWGPIDGAEARLLVARQHAAEWRFAVLDDEGYLLLGGLTRRRPTSDGRNRDRCRGGAVEIHVRAAMLTELSPGAGLPPDWIPVVADIVGKYSERESALRKLCDDPRARFPGVGLRRHVQMRDRSCVAPGCRRPARKSDQDHTEDHQHGGATVPANLDPLCPKHHLMKHKWGWTLTQPRPGIFRWRSPLRQIYWTRGEPIAADLPEPVPGPVEDCEDHIPQETDAAQPLPIFDGRRRRGKRSPPEPSPDPDPPAVDPDDRVTGTDDEPPPF